MRSSCIMNQGPKMKKEFCFCDSACHWLALPDKKSYQKLFCSLPEASTKWVTIDFKITVRNSILQCNENIQIHFCFFYRGQNVWRHEQSADKSSEYNNYWEFRELIRNQSFLASERCQYCIWKIAVNLPRGLSPFSTTLKTITSADTTLLDRDRNRDLQLNDGNAASA